MVENDDVVRPVGHAESTETFEWRDLRFHVVTPGLLTDDQIRKIRLAMPKVASVGQFADLVGVILGRYVRIRTVRPSPDIRFEVGR